MGRANLHLSMTSSLRGSAAELQTSGHPFKRMMHMVQLDAQSSISASSADNPVHMI